MNTYERVFPLGRRVYYLGGSGSNSGFGAICKHNPHSDERGFTVDILMEDGRVLSSIPPSDFGRLDAYGGVSGSHFVFEEEYRQYYQRNVESERVKTAKMRISALIRKTKIARYAVQIEGGA